MAPSTSYILPESRWSGSLENFCDSWIRKW